MLSAVKILFSGLIALIPSDNGQQLDVVLLKVASSHTHHVSDGSAIAKHNPMLITRAGSCTGDCPTSDATTAGRLFPDMTPTLAQAALGDATSGGGAWILGDSLLGVRKGSTSAPALPGMSFVTGVRPVVNGVPAATPTSSAEREDYSWLANMQDICGSGCTFDADLIGTNPPADLVAARFRLRSGKAYTYSVARVADKVLPVSFKRLDGSGSATTPQAVATWMAVDIDLGTASSIEIFETKFNGDPGRSMLLTPDSNGLIEVAVLNLPSFVPPATTSTLMPQVGKHFEAFYDLLTTVPARETRLVPTGATASNVDFTLVHPSSAVGSTLLNKLRLDVGRGPYDRVLCPPVGGGTP